MVLKPFLAALAAALFLVLPMTARAHSLGVDRGELVETSQGQYRLESKVPRRISPAILTPVLPERCSFVGNPNGERGSYSVAFNFTCSSPLTSDDRLSLPWNREGVLLTIRWAGQEPVTRLAKRDGATIEIGLDEWLAGSGSTLRAAERYTVLGIEHILAGLDHLLFVLALLFIVNGGWMLVKTITAFTVAHSITLGLATLGYVSLPSAPVEAAIALSIVFLASEIVWKTRGRSSLATKAPWVVAFAFGLLHGLGFAGALSEIGLPPAEIPIALLFFNVGVELGQLLFVAAIIATGRLLSLLPTASNWKSYVQLTIVYGIGVLATYWTVERTLAVFA